MTGEQLYAIQSKVSGLAIDRHSTSVSWFPCHAFANQAFDIAFASVYDGSECYLVYLPRGKRPKEGDIMLTTFTASDRKKTFYFEVDAASGVFVKRVYRSKSKSTQQPKSVLTTGTWVIRQHLSPSTATTVSVPIAEDGWPLSSTVAVKVVSRSFPAEAKCKKELTKYFSDDLKAAKNAIHDSEIAAEEPAGEATTAVLSHGFSFYYHSFLPLVFFTHPTVAEEDAESGSLLIEVMSDYIATNKIADCHLAVTIDPVPWNDESSIFNQLIADDDDDNNQQGERRGYIFMSPKKYVTLLPSAEIRMTWVEKYEEKGNMSITQS